MKLLQQKVGWKQRNYAVAIKTHFALMMLTLNDELVSENKYFTKCQILDQIL